MEIGEKIKMLRESRGMSQEELAKKAGYKSRSSINKIETDGRNLPQSKIAAIAKALDVTPTYLMGWEPEPEQKQTSYYLNEETAKKAQEIYDDPNTRILLDARRDLAPEDLDIVVALVKKLKGGD